MRIGGRILGAVVAISRLSVADAHAQAVRDSAGVRIVENTRPQWPAGRGWTLSSQPMLDIGGGDDTLYHLVTVMGAARLTSGEVAVAAMSSGNVRVFDARGRHVRTIGRSGRGPAEFLQVMGLHRASGDTLVVVDSRDEYEYFTPQGQHVRRLQLPGRIAGEFFSQYLLMSDGSLVGFSWPQGRRPEPGRWIDSASVLRVQPGSDPVVVRRHPVVEYTKRSPNPYTQAVAFGSYGRMASSGDGYFFGFPQRYEVSLHRPDGSVTQVIRAPFAATALPRDLVDRYKDSQLNLPAEGGGPVPPRLQEQRRQMVEAVTFAERLPAFSVLKVDAQRNLWVRDYYPEQEMVSGFASVLSTPTSWRVFNTDGTWLGTVTMPARFNPMDIGADYVLGLWRDADDVEHVRLYRLTKPQGGR